MDQRNKTDNIKLTFFSQWRKMKQWMSESIRLQVLRQMHYCSIFYSPSVVIIVMETDVQTRWCWVHIIDLFHVFYMSIRQIHACIIHPLVSGTASHSVIMLLVWSFSPLTNTAAACYYVTAMFMCSIRAACVRSWA